jgi:PrtD family type I secretion system ABC transporter
MGMEGTLAQRWAQVNARYLAAVERSSDVTTSYGGITKALRLFMQSAILGLGAYLVINNQLTAGGMIAASIMMGRALAPIETAIANWRGFIAARESRRRLADMLARVSPAVAATELPVPRRSLEVENLVVMAPGADTPILRDVRFQLAAGEAVGVIGPSGAGKTSLVRALVGIWRPARGQVRLDGSTLDQWPPDMLGKSVGFIAQSVELFDGSIAENIARMALVPDSEAVITAAQEAGAHDLIVRMPKGYDTPIGEAGVALSAGQRQRIALARALYGFPFLIVLDEPQSNLDNEGEEALMQAIRTAKQRGAIVVLVAHRPSALVACDKVLLLVGGTQQAFGPRDEVLQKLRVRQAQPAAAAAAAAGLKVVGDASGGER